MECASRLFGHSSHHYAQVKSCETNGKMTGAGTSAPLAAAAYSIIIIDDEDASTPMIVAGGGGGMYFLNSEGGTWYTHLMHGFV